MQATADLTIKAESHYKVQILLHVKAGVCACFPAEAITLVPAGRRADAVFPDRGKVFSTAQLKMGSGTSGMLVTEGKNK